MSVPEDFTWPHSVEVFVLLLFFVFLRFLFSFFFFFLSTFNRQRDQVNARLQQVRERFQDNFARNDLKTLVYYINSTSQRLSSELTYSTHAAYVKRNLVRIHTAGQGSGGRENGLISKLNWIFCDQWRRKIHQLTIMPHWTESYMIDNNKKVLCLVNFFHSPYSPSLQQGKCLGVQ